MRCTSLFFLMLLASTFSGRVQAQTQFVVEEAFPNLFFQNPVDIQHAGDGSNRLFVVEQKTGLIKVFDNDEMTSESTVFLDVSQGLRTVNGEEGLLGLAFHPDFATNGHFFVYYSASEPRRSVIERYTASPPSSMTADPESGLIILEVNQPYGNHNGGQLAFGPEDGYLYIALGDGGNGGDPDENGQDPKTLLGSILRIDVDNASQDIPYTIPDSNPFKGNQNDFREEIFAYGLRNPWRFSFDPVTNLLWNGDVGQGAREEVNIIEIGQDYGWNTMEGTLCYDPGVNCSTEGLTLPVWDYDRDDGQSITGGYVYRGSQVPELEGVYIYADFVTRRIWGLSYDGTSVTDNQLLTQVSFGIPSFGVSEEQELFICGFDGKIHRFASTGSTAITPELPAATGYLLENYPNPVQTSTTIPFAIKSSAHIEVIIYDMLGREVDRLVNQTLPAGEHQVEWIVSPASAMGTYYYSLKVDGERLHTRGLLVL